MRALVAEALGTSLLVAAGIGSGIMGQRLSDGNAGVTLLANSMATGAVLLMLIFTLMPVSGAHFNPAVSLGLAIAGSFPWRRVAPYIAAQTIGGIGGVVMTHVMFEHPLMALSRHERPGSAQLFSEVIATFGLLLAIHFTGKRSSVVPLTVAAYITGAHWFTSSTSFANPAVTIARGFTDTYSGIALSTIPGFVAAQTVGAIAATVLYRWLAPPQRSVR